MYQSLIKDGKAHFNVVTALLVFSYTKWCYFVSRQLNFGGCFCFTRIDVLFRLGSPQWYILIIGHFAEPQDNPNLVLF